MQDQEPSLDEFNLRITETRSTSGSDQHYLLESSIRSGFAEWNKEQICIHASFCFYAFLRKHLYLIVIAGTEKRPMRIECNCTAG